MSCQEGRVVLTGRFGGYCVSGGRAAVATNIDRSRRRSLFAIHVTDCSPHCDWLMVLIKHLN